MVAAAHTLAGLRIARRLTEKDCDIVEIRADAIADLPAIEKAMAAIQLPILLTVRHPAEGGIGALPLATRREWLIRLLPRATLVDIELRSLAALAAVATAAHEAGIAVIASNHHFHSTPSLAKMSALQKEAFQLGADIFKLAALAPTAPILARLLEFTAKPAPGPHAVMGMGTFGQVSRLALAQAGSVLNYGYLDKPNAPGQWEARELKRLLQAVCPAT